ncbi:DNA-directed RNA polymerase, mitochondrial [Heterocephalus glaber]|uniref:DNA-directed RNA polymerase, mitochondrial n=1 Tax=Heterocephalus glaber TaxID=10181 RepID=G5C5W4_HETGA|nr:DNA-directed RNA polymerase, mitochondrial [Heterocephalus glaber]
MAALRWGRGAADLSRALRSSGPPCNTAKEGILGGLWSPRRNSSASPCEQERRKDWGHVELLEGEWKQKKLHPLLGSPPGFAQWPHKKGTGFLVRRDNPETQAVVPMAI